MDVFVLENFVERRFDLICLFLAEKCLGWLGKAFDVFVFEIFLGWLVDAVGVFVFL